VVLKTANSRERLLDEVILFLHRMESKLPKEKQQIIRKLHRSDEVLKSRKVLIVDDDMRNIYSLTNALEEQGLVVYHSGERNFGHRDVKKKSRHGYRPDGYHDAGNGRL
jgi:PleD family two-component response regulator